MEEEKIITKHSAMEKKDSKVSPQSYRRRVIFHSAESNSLLAPWKDENKDMTLRRRFARFLTSKYEWYFTNRVNELKEEASQLVESNDIPEVFSQNKFNLPSLDNAWAFFEHFVLPRYYTNEEEIDNSKNSKKIGLVKSLTQKSLRMIFGKFKDERKRSEPGEVDRPTKLYPIWATSSIDLGDFGTSVGLYFYTVKSVSIIMLLAGILNIRNMAYFSSKEYGPDSQDSISLSYLTGSAVCTDTSWKFCPSCQRSDSEDERYAETTSGLKFVLANNCEIDKTSAILNITTLCFISVCFVILNFVLRKKEVEIDESMQTATDYSIVVRNPPADARDADEWKTFFEDIKPDIHVTVCTVDLNNEELLKPLIERRKLLLQIQNLLPAHIPFDDCKLETLIPLCIPPTWIQRNLFFSKSAETIYNEILNINSRVVQLTNKEYDCANVFVSFETEEAQRYVLRTMTTSIRNANLQSIPTGFPTECLFRKKHLLRINEPDEPSSIRWMDLNQNDLTCFFQRTVTFFVSFCLLVGCAITIYFAHLRSAFAASTTITFFNLITPEIVKFLNSFEAHRNQSSYEGSQFIKMTVFRWTNTAIITQIITPFTDTLKDGSSLINSIFTIFLSEMTVIPIIRMVNFMSNFRMYVLGPRAVDQRRMNLHFQGAYYQIGERYTSMTKVVFFTLFYCTVFPLGFFFATAILVITYWTDKYSLLRTWMATPLIGDEVSDFTKKFFLPLSIIAYAIIGPYQYASFPYDNVCDTKNLVPNEFVNITATTLNGLSVLINIPSNDTEYKHCLQNLFQWWPLEFPPTGYSQTDGIRWMNPTQENISTIYGWISVVFLCVVAWIVLSSALYSFRRYFFKVYKPRGDPTPFNFSEDEGIDGYVPQLQLPGYAFPTLLADVSGIGNGLIGWSSPSQCYDDHSIFSDVKKIVYQEDKTMVSGQDVYSGEFTDKHFLFSVVKHWPKGRKSD